MSASNAIKSFGTFLKIGDGATPTETFTTVAEVMTINGLDISAKQEEVTNHSSGDPWRQFISTLLDGGAVDFDVNFIPTDATHSYSAGLLSDMVNRVRRNFKLQMTDGSTTTWAFTANIQKFKASFPVDGVIKAAISLKNTGKPTLA